MEYIDVINQEDQVTGKALRGDIYSKLLMHRIVHVLVFNDQGKMALQLRSKKLSFSPGHWSTSVGGHVQSGEDYEMAAKREFQEELGVDGDFELFSKDFYQVEGGPPKFIVCYKSVFNGPFSPDPAEVDAVEFFTLEEISAMIAKGEKFHPELLFILNKYFLKQQN